MASGSTMVGISGCQSGNARRICDLTQPSLIEILTSSDEAVGTKLAAFKCLSGKENRDKYGLELLREHLNDGQLECVLAMMSRDGIREVMGSGDLTDPVRIKATRVHTGERSKCSQLQVVDLF